MEHAQKKTATALPIRSSVGAKPEKKNSVFGNVEAKHDRGQWSSKADFLFSCVGYIVGLGNLWRFPYMAFSYGGGAFLIPYVIMLFVVGVPLFLLELALGQYSALGPAKMYRQIGPLFGGIGIGMVINCFLKVVYYNVIVSWTIYYFWSSMTSDLPWQYCSSNSSTCVSYDDYVRCHNVSAENSAEQQCMLNDDAQSAPEDFFYKRALRLGPSITEGFGMPVPHMAASLGVAWLLVYFASVRGIKSSGKVVWVTATLPYLMLAVLLVRGLTLPGMSEGLRFYTQPSLEPLYDVDTWVKAAAQILFSLSIGNGGLMSFASYCRFDNNVWGDSILISLINCATSVFGGFVVFSFVGFIAETLQVPVQEAAREGFGLAFIAFPQAVAHMPLPTLWAMLVNATLLILGLDSAFSMVDCVATALMDEWPRLRRSLPLTFAIVCFACFLVGLLCFATPSGYYWMSVVDTYNGGWPLIFLALCETIVALVYGLDRISKNLQDMCGRPLGLYFTVCLKYLSMPTLLFLFLASSLAARPASYRNVPYPWWAQAIGIALALSHVLAVGGYALYAIYHSTKRQANGWRERLTWLVSPRSGWEMRRSTSIVPLTQSASQATLKSQVSDEVSC